MKRVLFVLSLIILNLVACKNETDFEIPITEEKNVTVQIHAHRESASFYFPDETKIFVGQDYEQGISYGDMDIEVTYFFDNRIYIEVERLELKDGFLEVAIDGDDLVFTKDRTDPDILQIFFTEASFEQMKGKTIFLSFKVKTL